MHALAHQPSTATHGSRWERLAFAGGLAAAVLYLGGVALFGAFVVPQMPPLAAPAAQVARFYAAQSAGGLYPLVSYLGHAELPLLLLFFGGLFGVLRRAEGGSEALAAAVFAGGVVGAVIVPIVFVIENHVLLGLAAAGGDALTVRAFDGMGPVSFGLSGFTQAVVVGGTAALLRVEPRVPRWLRWYAIAVVVVSLIGTGTLMVNSLFPLAALATLLYRIWILVLSGVLLRSSTPARTRLVPQ